MKRIGRIARYVGAYFRAGFFMVRQRRYSHRFFLMGCSAILLAAVIGLPGQVSAQSPKIDDRKAQESLSSPEEAALIAAERALLEGLAQKGLSEERPSAPAPSKSELTLPQQNILEVGPSASNISQEATEPLAVQQSTDLDTVIPEEADAEEVVPKPLTRKAKAAVFKSTTRDELEASKRRITELEQELDKVKGQLTAAEIELSRLASISEARSKAMLGAPAVQPEPRVAQTQNEEFAKAEAAPTSADLMIVTVNVEKAELRLGPGKEHSPLMTVARGARLAVEARKGEWFRVFAPNGQRAWIRTSMVTFGATNGTSKDSATTAKVRGYSSALEDQAFRRVQAITSPK